MSDPREQRRLAAIVAADVAGYSRLMGRDESGTLSRLKEHRRLRLEPALARNAGRLVKLTGDGALVEFASAVDALRASVEFQQAVTDCEAGSGNDRIAFRLGIHVGDLIVDGEDIYGDAVNIAARLEAEASAGGILLSRAVRDAVAGKLKVTFEDVGALELKNIEKPVRAYRTHWDSADWQPTKAARPAPATSPPVLALALPDRPSIAVLPFQNMSGDAEQDYFADGMVEDIITSLSRNRGLFVVARNSTFTYKGQPVDIRRVGRELGVRYVLEGSVRKAGTKVRITGQLLEAATGAHIWAERFDGDLQDVFELQDQVTSKVVAGVAPSLQLAEMERAQRKTGDLAAYDLYLRGVAAHSGYTEDGARKAIELFNRAVSLDPKLAHAYAQLAQAWFILWSFGWSEDPAQALAEAGHAARRGFEADGNDALCLIMHGYILQYSQGRFEEGLALAEHGLQVDPNYALGHTYCGYALNNLARPDAAIARFRTSLRLNPLDPVSWFPQGGLASSHFMLGKYDEAASWAEKALGLRSNFPSAQRIAMASHALAGRIDAARTACASYRLVEPDARLATIAALYRDRRDSDTFERFVQGLRLAGLPE
jgi:TolB-like protein/class 3 adenylate cyclase